MKTRYSCYAYKSEHADEEKLYAIIEAGTNAATGMDKQPLIIPVLRDPEIRAALAKLNAAASPGMARCWIRRAGEAFESDEG